LVGLYPDRLGRGVERGFDAQRERVRAVRRERFDGVVTSESSASTRDHADPQEVARMLARAALEDLPRAMGLGEEDVQILERLAFLRAHMPELALPELPIAPGAVADEEALELVTRWCWGKRSFADLRKLRFAKLMREQLPWAAWSAMEEHAPQRLHVPSGSHIKVEYSGADPPVVAVRIQEVFGWAATPRLADGRVPVMMHLLAPSYRPAQVTQDLASFWENTYPEVRKELRARYPEHPWPEDPWSAKAIRK